LIAEFTAAFPESPPAVRDPAREQLAGLIRARRLVVTKQADLAKGLASAPEEAKPILEAVVAQLATAEEALETAIVKQVDADTRLAQLTTALVTAPGVGPVTAAALAALLPELGHTTGAKMAALVGVAPFADDSGEHQGKRQIAGGRGDARRALYMAALSATRTKGVLGEFGSAERLGVSASGSSSKLMSKLVSHWL
jgi:transposase